MIDVFKVGVHIGMTTNATGVLSILLRELTGLHVAAERLEHGLGRIGTAALGAGAVFAGWKVISGLVDATKHAEKLNHELVKLQTGANLTDAQTGAAGVLAFKVSRDIKGTDVAENVKMQRELFGVFGDMGEAQDLLPMIAQGSRAVANFTDKQGTDLAQIAVRALELRGHISKDGKVDPKEFAQEFNAMVRSIVASEGLIDPQKLFMFIRQAGPAARNMSTEQMWGMAPAIMNALGSGPAGTALNSLFSQMIGHVVAGKRVAIAMEEAGMLTPGKWAVEKGGKVRMDADAVPDQAGFMDHPFTWLHDHLGEMRNKTGKDGKPVDLLAIVQEIFQLSSRSTTARLINDIDSNWPIIKNEEARWKRTPNPDAIAKEQNDKDLSVNIHNLNEAWNNFLAALGGPGIPVAINVLQGLTRSLNFLQEAVIAHPTIAADIFYLVGALGALTALSGSIAILSVALGPLRTGLAAIAGVSGLPTVGAALSGVATGMGGLALAVAPFAVGGAAALAMGALMDRLHELAGFGNKSGFSPLTGGPGSGAAPAWHGQEHRPDSVLPMPGDSDFRVSPYVAPHSGDGTGKRSGDIYLDGKKVGMIIDNHTANSLSRPPTGRAGADYRVSPLMPGMSSAFG